MKIEVDYDLCQSLGVCEMLAPQTFEIRSDGTMHLVEERIAPDDETAAQDAVAACPSFALRLVR